MEHTVTFPHCLVTFPGYVSFQWAMTMWIQLAISHDTRVGIEETHRQRSGGQAQQDQVSFKPYSAAFLLPSVLWCSFCSQSEFLGVSLVSRGSQSSNNLVTASSRVWWDFTATDVLVWVTKPAWWVWRVDETSRWHMFLTLIYLCAWTLFGNLNYIISSIGSLAPGLNSTTLY